MNCKHAHMQLHALSTIRDRETSQSNHLSIKKSVLLNSKMHFCFSLNCCVVEVILDAVLFIYLFILGGFDWTLWTLSCSGWPWRTAVKCFMLSLWSFIDPDSKKLLKKIRRSSEYWCSPSSLHRKQWRRLSKWAHSHLCAALLSLLLAPTLGRKSLPTCHAGSATWKTPPLLLTCLSGKHRQGGLNDGDCRCAFFQKSQSKSQK